MVKKQLSIQNIALNFIEKKNNKTFSELINCLKPGLQSFVYKYVKDEDLAKEVVSQTFITIWEKIDQYNPTFNFSTWAYAIAKNEAIGLIRFKNKNVSYNKYVENHSCVLQICSPVFNMNTEVIGLTGEDLTQALYDASLSVIDQLEEPYKRVMIEREINQKQLHHIAEDTGWKLNTVKTRLRKARKDVAKLLCKKYPDMVCSYMESQI